jgi:hypothetical protein
MSKNVPKEFLFNGLYSPFQKLEIVEDDAFSLLDYMGCKNRELELANFAKMFIRVVRFHDKKIKRINALTADELLVCAGAGYVERQPQKLIDLSETFI